MCQFSEWLHQCLRAMLVSHWASVFSFSKSLKRAPLFSQIIHNSRKRETLFIFENEVHVSSHVELVSNEEQSWVEEIDSVEGDSLQLLSRDAKSA